MELTQKYEDLEKNYNCIRQVSEEMTDDWRNSELRARDFEAKYNKEKQQREEQVLKMQQEFQEREQQWVWF